jgi:ribonucleoside-diphosphate reductase alpha chain
VTGLHYFLIKAGYRYGSEDCIEFLERLFATIRNEAYKASMYLAREKGSFPAYDFSKLRDEKFMKTLPPRIRSDIKKNGLRNAILLTVAPTGTISMVLGVSTGLEPIFAPVYKRRWRSGSTDVWNETLVIDPLFKDLYLRGRDVSHCVGAYDVTPEEHIKVQSVVQQFIDSAVSKTCNLPATFSPEGLYDDLITYANDIKGFTFYRAGSRGNEPLEAVDISTIDLDALIKEGKMEILAQGVDTCKSGVCEI